MATLLPTSSTYLDDKQIRDCISGEGLTLDVDQATTCRNEEEDCFAREEVIKHMSYACEGEDSDEEDDSMPFERMARKMEDISGGDGGVRKMVLKVGAGKVVPEDSIVRVHYNAYLEMAAEPYDSTRLRNKPHKFRLGSHEVLTGFDFAVSGMRRGELSRYMISAKYALGEAGCPPRVPPNATVMMEIELLSFVEEGGVEDFFHLTNDERGKLPFEKIKKVCMAQNEEGKIFVKEKQWGRALSVYKKAMNILELVNLKNATEQREQQQILLKVYVNMALCSVRQASYPYVIMLCSKALEIDSRNIKAMFRKSQAYRFLSDFERAKYWLMRARKQEPNNVDISNELQLLAKDVNNFNMLEKDMCKRMFTKATVQEIDPGESSQPENPTETKSAPQPTNEILSGISTEFRSMVDAKLKEYQEDGCKGELPFPACNLTVPEIGYVMQAAIDRDLDVVQKGEGYNLKLKIRKKLKEEE